MSFTNINYKIGCITDCDCAPGEKCSKWNCVPDVCDIQTDSNVHFLRVPNQQNPGRSITSKEFILSQSLSKKHNQGLKRNEFSS